MKRAALFLFAIAFILSLTAGAWGQNLVDDAGLQKARAKAKQTVQQAFQQNKKLMVTMTDERRMQGYVSNPQPDGFTLIDQRKSLNERLSYTDVREVRKAGMSTGKKWAIAGAVVGGLMLTSMIATRPWRSE